MAIVTRSEFSKMKVQPTKEEYFRGTIAIDLHRSETSGETFAERITTAIAYAQLDDRDNAMKWLEKSFASQDDLIPNYLRSPLLDPLRGDPRFDAFVRKLNLVP